MKGAEVTDAARSCICLSKADGRLLILNIPLFTPSVTSERLFMASLIMRSPRCSIDTRRSGSGCLRRRPARVLNTRLWKCMPAALQLPRADKCTGFCPLLNITLWGQARCEPQLTFSNQNYLHFEICNNNNKTKKRNVPTVDDSTSVLLVLMNKKKHEPLGGGCANISGKVE